MLKKISSLILCLGMVNSFVCQSVSGAINKESIVDSSLSGNSYVEIAKGDGHTKNKTAFNIGLYKYKIRLNSKKIAIAAGVTGFTAILLTFYIIHKLKSEPETDINKNLENNLKSQKSNDYKDEATKNWRKKETDDGDEEKKPKVKHDTSIGTSKLQPTEKPSDINEVKVKQVTDITHYGVYLDPTLYLLFKIPALEKLGFLNAYKEFWTFKKGCLSQPLKLAFMIYLVLRLITGAMCPTYHVFMLIVIFFTKIFQRLHKWSDLLEHAKALVITALLNCAPITSSIIGGTCDKIVPLTFDFKPEVKVDEKFDKALGIILGYNARFLNRAVRVSSFDAYAAVVNKQNVNFVH